MEKIVKSECTPEDHYEILDVYLTDILQRSGAVIEGETIKILLQYDRHLKIALGLPVEVAN